MRSGRAVLLVSAIVLRELDDAPEEVRSALSTIPPSLVEMVEVTPAAVTLRDAYVSDGIVGPRWIDDATHVALATIARADAIVSWNFRHIVRLDKMRRYNHVNLSHGYAPLSIVSPTEVRLDEDEEDNAGV